MTDLARGRLAIKYILIETVPSFLMGVTVFLFILLMFQALRLTEFVLVHGVSLATVAQLMVYMSISFLPVILPMSLLFSVLITYGRLSADAEIVAMKALGLNMNHLALPAIILGLLTSVASAHTAFFLAPWGNRQFELKVHELGRLKAGATIREGVFSEGFFDLVIYANQVDSRAGLLSKVFIYDERDPKAPLTIIAREGRLIRDQDPKVGDRAQLRLIDGSIHRTNQEAYTKIEFGSYDINLSDATDIGEKSKSMPSMTLPELNEQRAQSDLPKDRRAALDVEYHRRISLSFACILFALIGVGLGTTTNRRLARASGMVVCLIVVVSYWALYVAAEGLAKSGALPAAAALWLVNGLFGLLAYWSLRRASEA